MKCLNPIRLRIGAHGQDTSRSRMPPQPSARPHPMPEAAYGKEGDRPLEVHQGAPVSRAIASMIIRSGMSLPA
ncbi:MAG: hypothetical protein WB581_04650 [Halobacteriota archaeon]